MSKDFDIQESYKKLQSKHKLPSFEELEDDFELSFIDYKLKNDLLLLRSIRRKINEKVIFFCRIIEGLIYPQQASIISMIEGKQLTEDEKFNIEKFYKKLMYYERESLKLDVMPDEKKSAEYVINVNKLWKQFKVDMVNVVEKMQSSWNLVDSEDKESYVG